MALRSDCTDVQAYLGLCCLHIPEDTFLHGAAHLITSLYCYVYIFFISFFQLEVGDDSNRAVLRVSVVKMRVPETPLYTLKGSLNKI